MNYYSSSYYYYYLNTYFIKDHKIFEVDAFKMLEFLINNSYVEFSGLIFQQTVDIPMRMNCVPLLADISLRV